MAYHGYIPIIHQWVMNFQNPKILEIGVLSGITTFSLIHRLSHTHSSFLYEGVDIIIRPDVSWTIDSMSPPREFITLYEMNSLDFLKQNKNIYDVVLIDGDHNYYTVSKELSYLNAITHNNSLVIIDDYHGKWAEKDLWYGEKDEFNSKHATKRVETDKCGVKPAVDDFLKENKQWTKNISWDGEPVVLIHENATYFEIKGKQ